MKLTRYEIDEYLSFEPVMSFKFGKLIKHNGRYQIEIMMMVTRWRQPPKVSNLRYNVTTSDGQFIPFSSRKIKQVEIINMVTYCLHFRTGKMFSDLSKAQQTGIIDRIWNIPENKEHLEPLPAFKKVA